MNIEKQVLSPEIAQRLKALGVEQESYFVWEPLGNGVSIKFFNLQERNSHGKNKARWIAAYTVPELVERLGDNFDVLSRLKSPEKGFSALGELGDDVLELDADTLANALGLLLEKVRTNA